MKNKVTRIYKLNNRENVLEYNRKSRGKNRESINEKATIKRYQQRSKLLDKLGNICKNCGFIDRRALNVDHIHGNGNIERKSYNGNRDKHVKDLLEMDIAILEKNYQILCANCNSIKREVNKEYRSYSESKESR